jgi:hypothetical protein
MTIRFLRGDEQAPKGHAIFIAHSTLDSRVVLTTYCVVLPTPFSVAKYLPPLLASQIPLDELQDANNVPIMPIPPMLEDGSTFDHLQMLAERREDDMVDLGTINPNDTGARMQMAQQGCQEYGQFYVNYISRFPQPESLPSAQEEITPLDDLTPEELRASTMTDRERLAELSKLVGTARYALDGHDTDLLQRTKRDMLRLANRLPDKFRGDELIVAAAEPGERGARLAQLYIERGYKLLDEEYADIPGIERSIRELQH